MTNDPGPASYLTADQIADELHVHKQTVQRYFRECGLPGRKIGNTWTTTRAALDAWVLGGPASPSGALEHGTLDLETK